MAGQRTFAMLSGVQKVLGVRGKDGSPIPEMDHEEATAAALVRRAAPDMLEALKAMAELMGWVCGNLDVLPDDLMEANHMIVTAIAKAEGRS